MFKLICTIIQNKLVQAFYQTFTSIWIELSISSFKAESLKINTQRLKQTKARE